MQGQYFHKSWTKLYVTCFISFFEMAVSQCKCGETRTAVFTILCWYIFLFEYTWCVNKRNLPTSFLDSEILIIPRFHSPTPK